MTAKNNPLDLQSRGSRVHQKAGVLDFWPLLWPKFSPLWNVEAETDTLHDRYSFCNNNLQYYFYWSRLNIPNHLQYSYVQTGQYGLVIRKMASGTRLPWSVQSFMWWLALWCDDLGQAILPPWTLVFLMCKIRVITVYFIGLLWELKKLIYIKCLEQCLEHSKCHRCLLLLKLANPPSGCEMLITVSCT